MNEWGFLGRGNEDQHDTSAQGHEGGKKAREQVEKTADRIRDELLLTLEELERRRERVMDVRYQTTRHRTLLVGAALTALAVTGVGVGLAVWRSRYRQHHMAQRRFKAFQRAWNHPGRLATRSKQRPFAVEAGQKLIMIFGTALATRIAKSSAQSLVPRRSKASADAPQK